MSHVTKWMSHVAEWVGRVIHNQWVLSRMNESCHAMNVLWLMYSWYALLSMCDMTLSFCDMTHSCHAMSHTKQSSRDLFIRDMKYWLCVTWLIYFVTWLIHATRCHVINIHSCHDSLIMRDMTLSFCDMTHSCHAMSHNKHSSCDSFIRDMKYWLCVTWLIYFVTWLIHATRCHVINTHSWHDTLILCDMTHLFCDMTPSFCDMTYSCHAMSHKKHSSRDLFIRDMTH